MPKVPAKKLLVAYVPVLHRGYWQFFEHYKDADGLFVIGSDLLKKIDYLRKDLRALTPIQVTKLIRASNFFPKVKVLSRSSIKKIDQLQTIVIMPDEDISRELGKLFKQAKVQYYPVFLRWDRRSLAKTAVTDPQEVVSRQLQAKKIMSEAYQMAGRSSDIWRRVGAVLVAKNGQEIGRRANRAEPEPHSPWMEGDPRNIFKQGINTDLAVFIHAEAALIAEAAKAGQSLLGSSLYITTFPCPWCAKLIAHSGINQLFYAEGYGSLDAKRVLTDYKVKVRRVIYTPPAGMEHQAVWVPYKKT